MNSEVFEVVPKVDGFKTLTIKSFVNIFLISYTTIKHARSENMRLEMITKYQTTSFNMSKII